jgi:hypothetical protein
MKSKLKRSVPVINKQLYVIVFLALVSAALPLPLRAQKDWTSAEEFRTQYMQFIDALSARVPPADESSWAVGLRHQISDLRQSVNALTYPGLNQLAKAYDRQPFISMVGRLTAGNIQFQEAAQTRLVASIKLQPRGPIHPPDYSSAVSGTPCSTNPTDGQTLYNEKIGLTVATAAQAVLDYGCQTIVVVVGEGTNAPFCVVALIAKAAVLILDTVISGQEFCNQLLDGAKADATLADVEDIHTDVEFLNTHLTAVDSHLTNDFGALDSHLTNVDSHLTGVNNDIDTRIAALTTTVTTLIAGLSDQLTASTNKLFTGEQQILRFTTGTLSWDPTLTKPCSQSQVLNLNLSVPAPPGGLLINLSLDSPIDTISLPSLLPLPLIMLGGTTTAQVRLFCVTAGTTKIHANALPFASDVTATVTFN